MKIALLLHAVIFSDASWLNTNAAEFVPGAAYYTASGAVPPELNTPSDSVPAQMTGASPLLSLQDLATGTSDGPLSLIFLEHLGEPRELDLETAAAITRHGWGWGNATGEKLAAVIKNTRVEVKPGTQVQQELIPQFAGVESWRRKETGKYYRVDGFDFTVTNAPYLPEVPAVCRLMNDAWGEMKKTMLQRDDVADADVILPDRNGDLQALPHNQHVSSAQARECIEAVLGEFLRKFDISQTLTWRSIWDPEKFGRADGGLVSVDLCAGESVFSIYPKLVHSLPFNPIEDHRGTGLYAVLLSGENKITAGISRSRLEGRSTDRMRDSNFVAVRVFDNPGCGFFGRQAADQAKGFKIVYTYPQQMDDIRQDARRKPGDEEYMMRSESSFRDGAFPYCECLSTDIGTDSDSTTKIERGGIPNLQVIERVRKMGTAFLNAMEEEAERRRREDVG